MASDDALPLAVRRKYRSITFKNFIVYACAAGSSAFHGTKIKKTVCVFVLKRHEYQL
jgi:hypothetical protein